jgi:hypothetical protein
MPLRVCHVSFKSATGITHGVDVEAETLYEAAWYYGRGRNSWGDRCRARAAVRETLHAMSLWRGFAVSLLLLHVALCWGEIGLIHFRLPQVLRQVPREWQHSLRPHAWVLAYGGVVLGLGVVTEIQTSGFYLVIIWPVLCLNVRMAVFSCLAYGLGRLVPMFLVVIRGELTPAHGVIACWPRSIRQ